jgi:ketosteroid isomerase-like protein
MLHAHSFPNPIPPSGGETMAAHSSVSVVHQLISAINSGNLEAAVALYEPSAVLLSPEGEPARGTAELRAALSGFLAMKPKLESQAERIFESGDLALYLGRWSLNGTDPSGKPITLVGESTDVLRRQADGSWLIAIDNPWGVKTLPPASEA